MSLRSLFSRLVARWEGAFDRAIRDDAARRGGREPARGEFTSTLIIDHGAATGPLEGRATSRRLFD